MTDLTQRLAALEEYEKWCAEYPPYTTTDAQRMSLADAAIEELVTALEQKHDFYQTIDLSTFNHAVARAEAAEKQYGFMRDEALATGERLVKAERLLAEREGQRCGDCGHWSQHEAWPDQGWCPQHNEMDAECRCDEYQPRPEGGE